MFLGKLYILSQDGYIHRLDADNGMELKKFHILGSLVSTPIGSGNYMYVGAGDNNMYCWDMAYDTLVWKSPVGGPIESSPIIVDTAVVFGCNDGKVYSISKNYGNQAWTYDPGTATSFTSSPIYVASVDQVYIGAKDGNMYAITPAAPNGLLRWRYATNGPIESSPISYGGNIIFGSYDKTVYCIDSGSGLPRWTVPTADRVLSSPFAANQVIYIGSYDYNLYAIHIITGALRWKFPTTGAIRSSPLVNNGIIYCGSTDKNFYALDTLGGAIKWKQNLNGAIETSPVLIDSSKNALYSSVSGSSRY